MCKIELFFCPLEGGGFQIEVECGSRHLEIAVTESCPILTLTDSKEEGYEMEADEYLPEDGQFPMGTAVEGMRKRLTWVLKGGKADV